MKVGHCEAGRTLSINRDGKSAYAAGQKYVINGTQVNHAQLLLPQGEGILISYDDQDGNLPYGKEYACELVYQTADGENNPTNIVIRRNKGCNVKAEIVGFSAPSTSAIYCSNT